MDINYCAFCKKAEAKRKLFNLKTIDEEVNIDLLTISYEILNFLRVSNFYIVKLHCLQIY